MDYKLLSQLYSNLIFRELEVSFLSFRENSPRQIERKVWMCIYVYVDLKFKQLEGLLKLY